MAEITNPQVVAFSNNHVRPTADDLYQLYFRCKQILADYVAADMANQIVAGGTTNLVADGSATDGRTRITGNDVIQFVSVLGDYVGFVEGAAVSTLNRTNIIAKPHVQDS